MYFLLIYKMETEPKKFYTESVAKAIKKYREKKPEAVKRASQKYNEKNSEKLKRTW